jgi:hypothetical protein
VGFGGFLDSSGSLDDISVFHWSTNLQSGCYRPDERIT